jgi:hypothetical protein
VHVSADAAVEVDRVLLGKLTVSGATIIIRGSTGNLLAQMTESGTGEIRQINEIYSEVL